MNERVMSRSEAAALIMDMARGGGIAARGRGASARRSGAGQEAF